MTRLVWLCSLAWVLGACADDDPSVGSGNATEGSSSGGVMPTSSADDTADSTAAGNSADGSTTDAGECTDDDTCDDDDACTDDACSGGTCTHVPAAAGTACTDADGSAGVCMRGGCVVECSGDLDCDDGNACTDDACDLATGQCGNDPIDGIEAPSDAQVEGDCLVVECADGVEMTVPDDDDVEDDRNDCTTDTCSRGTALHEPVMPGSACGVDGVCDREAMCAECIAPEDCTMLPEDDDCQVRTCNAGACGQDFTPAGTPVNDTLQDMGDCQVVECDGVGGMQSADDDLDLPVDGLDCTTDTCDMGVPSNDPLPIDSPCAAGICDGTGMCVGCNDPSDCAGSDTFCQQITCVANMCGVSNTVAGIPLPAFLQFPNDCQQLQCNGSGGTQSIPDNADTPADDGNDCTSQSCSNGLPLHPNRPINFACDDNGGIVCDGAGSCVACNAANQCSGAGTCQLDACVANTCTTTPQPAGNPCSDGQFCTQTDTCNGAGLCVGAGNPCPGPDGDGNCSESCNEATDACDADDPAGSSCQDSLFCTGGDTCNGAGTCVGGPSPCAGPDGDGNCNESCNENLDNCTAPDAPGSACNDGLFCTQTDTCNAGGVCTGSGNPCPGADGDSDCSEGCNEVTDACTANDPFGSACNDGLFCTQNDTCNASGTCVGSGNPCPGADGDIDCSEGCNETTDACTANDPVNSACNDGLFCTLTDRCNASGICVGTSNPCPGPDGDGNCNESCNEGTDTCSANDPGGSACNDGLFCTQNDTCNGSGTCVGNGNPCPGPDGDADCSETCNETTNNCTTNDPNGSLCRAFGACFNGSCIGL